ncbi:hypothetical protein ASPCAL08559 [Aspergillus calidoustus]|uniref:TIGR02453 family protein n=1 Tax=Aspergillus calidoustus TaxID=454130 RepID=A0A0U5GSD8_ASPCI|nr:hypothetical protein ASPCAL08559 [Aspergillus calidoustus]
MPSRKRLSSLPLSRQSAKVHRKDSPATDVDAEGSAEEEFDNNSSDDDYQPDAEEDQSEKDDPPTSENDAEKEDYPRRTTIIPYEKLRPLGGVEYSSTRVHKNTLLYLKDLRISNNRDWFKSHEREFRRAMKDWETFVETLTPKIIAFDGTIPELPPRDIIFRIYRDLRFSRDQKPYKSHFSAAFSRTGRRRPYACYYLQLDPGSSYVGGGLWAPEPATIHLLRQSIDERPEDWRQVLSSEPFRSMFLPAAKGKTEGALKEFAVANKEGALKTKPKGYDADHRDIELLKLRNYHVVKYVDDEIFTAEDGQERIIQIISTLQPFVTFLNSIIMPDQSEH